MDDPFDGLAGKDVFEVREWHVVFRRESSLLWLNRLPGRFRHVLCFGYVPGADCWLFFDPGQFKAEFLVVPNASVDGVLQTVAGDHAILRVKPGEPVKRLRVWFSCVQMVAQVVGIPSCALRPDTFWRDCIRHGAEVVEDERPVRDQESDQEADQVAQGAGAGGA